VAGIGRRREPVDGGALARAREALGVQEHAFGRSVPIAHAQHRCGVRRRELEVEHAVAGELQRGDGGARCRERANALEKRGAPGNPIEGRACLRGLLAEECLGLRSRRVFEEPERVFDALLRLRAQRQDHGDQSAGKTLHVVANCSAARRA
jgi:hypothetical protein